MSDSFRIHRDAYLAVGLFALAWLVLAIVLDAPLDWLHSANGTVPALQQPIDAFITIALAALVAGGLRAAAARRSVSWRPARLTKVVAAETDAAASSKAGLATTR